MTVRAGSVRDLGKAATVSACLALAGMAGGAGGATDPVLGYWLTENGKAIIEIAPCGDAVCGHMAWLEEPRDMGGMLKRDMNNPDQRLRGRPLCGLRILSGFTRAESGEWDDGEIYSPRHGKVFSAVLSMAEESEILVVRGYVGLELFGESQEWSRVGSDRGGCREP